MLPRPLTQSLPLMLHSQTMLLFSSRGLIVFLPSQSLFLNRILCIPNKLLVIHGDPRRGGGMHTNICGSPSTLSLTLARRARSTKSSIKQSKKKKSRLNMTLKLILLGLPCQTVIHSHVRFSCAHKLWQIRLGNVSSARPYAPSCRHYRTDSQLVFYKSKQIRRKNKRACQ